MARRIKWRNQSALWSEPELAGYLEKRGTKKHGIVWKRRLFLLQGHALFYFVNEQHVRTVGPLAMIPVEGSRTRLVQAERNRLVFCLRLGPQYHGFAKRDTYVLAADSPRVLEAWIQMLKIASSLRTDLYGKLRKARTAFGELKTLLSTSPSDTRLLSNSEYPKAEALQIQLREANREKERLNKQVSIAALDADKSEAALLHARMRMPARQGSSKYVLSALQLETDAIRRLYKLLQARGNLYQGQGVENLQRGCQIHLRRMVQNAMDLIQERHAMVRGRAPRYSFQVDPRIYEHDDGGGERSS